MATRKRTPDVEISGSMGFYQFAQLTTRARRWVRQHVAREAWNGDASTFYCDDMRMAQDIAGAMTEAGLAVR